MKTIAVTSGKGGVGKTSLSVNLAVSLADMGYRAIVFDADLALANVEVLMGARAELNLQHVVAEQNDLCEIVQRGPSGVGFIAGGSGVPSLMRSGPKKLAMFFNQVQELEQDADVLIFDTSAGLENRVMAFVKFADEVLLVTTPEPASVTDAYATLKTIFRQKPLATVKLAVNMAKNEKEALDVYDVLSRITKDFLKKELEFAGFVRRDDQVGQFARQRKPFALNTKDSVAKTDTIKLAATLVEDVETSPTVAA